MKGFSKFGVPNTNHANQDSKMIRIPAYLLLLIFVSFTAYAGGSIYWIIKKDNDIEKFRRIELELQNQIKQKELLLQQKEQHVEQLERRVEIIDAIKGLSHANVSEKDVKKIAKQIDFVSQKYGHDPLLLVSIMSTESSFLPTARSHVGARGLMQLMPKTGSYLSKQVKKTPMLIGYDTKDGIPNFTYQDIEGNIQLGALYFTQLLMRYKNLDHALFAYNMGPTKLDERLKNGGSVPLSYREKVMRTYNNLKNQQKVKDNPLPSIFTNENILARADFSLNP